jgi:hypothetical protein
MESLDPACNELKHAYDACFNGWFTDSFLKGEHKGMETPCDEILQFYTACVKVIFYFYYCLLNAFINFCKRLQFDLQTALQTKKIELDELSEMSTTTTTQQTATKSGKNVK